MSAHFQYERILHMNVYDFDNTIYRGESVLDFYIFCLRRYPWLIRYAFIFVISWIKYKLMLLNLEQLMSLAERYAGEFLLRIKDMDALVKEFWDTHQKKIKRFYLETRKEDDVILSASVHFLLDEICARLGIKNLICSSVNVRTGHVEKLCFRQNKPQYFRDSFPDAEIENFYTDSMNDLPMIKLSKNAFIVKGEKLEPVKIGS